MSNRLVKFFADDAVYRYDTAIQKLWVFSRGTFYAYDPDFFIQLASRGKIFEESTPYYRLASDADLTDFLPAGYSVFYIQKGSVFEMREGRVAEVEWTHFPYVLVQKDDELDENDSLLRERYMHEFNLMKLVDEETRATPPSVVLRDGPLEMFAKFTTPEAQVLTVFDRAYVHDKGASNTEQVKKLQEKLDEHYKPMDDYEKPCPPVPSFLQSFSTLTIITLLIIFVAFGFYALCQDFRARF